MTIFIIFMTGTVVLWLLRQLWPARSLSYIHAHEWVQAKDRLNLTMLDVRDATDYLEEHIPGSINISLGRLPYVWQHDLSSDEDVLILSSTRYQSNKAARILRKIGFRNLYTVQGAVFSKHTCFPHFTAKGVRHC